VVKTAPDHAHARKEPPMARPYKFTPSDVPARRTNSLYADNASDFLAQGAESMEVSLEGVRPETLRAGLRTAIKGRGSKM
jgi:hypothetical protein